MSEGAVGIGDGDAGEAGGEGGGATEAPEAPEAGGITGSGEAPEDPAAPPPPTPDYRSNLPDGLGQHPALERLDSVEALVREHVNLQKVMGGPKMMRPDENWGQAEWDRFFNEIGRPSDASGYEIGEVTVPEGVEIDEAWRDDGIGHMHKLGLTQDQLQGVLSWYYKEAGQRHAQAQADSEAAEIEGLKGLKQQWGRAYEQNLAQADRALIQLAGSKEAAASFASEVLADGRKLGTHPVLIAMLAEVGNFESEDGLHGEQRGAGHIYTPAEAERELRRLEGDEEFRKKLLDKNHPEHPDVVKRRSDLIRMIKEPQPNP